jgi:hypothetical protein
MTDPGMARQRLGPKARFQIPEFAFGAAAREMIALQRGDACGIIAAIFKPLERIDELLRDRSAPENADNAAHAGQYLQIDEKPSKQRRLLLTRNADRQILNNYCGLRQR